MLEKGVTLACALLALLIAVSFESWLRRHHGNKELASKVYVATLEKYSEFWYAQIFPTVLTVGAALLVYSFGIKPGKAAILAYLLGALSFFISLFLGSRSFSSATVSSASMAYEGDIKTSFKSAFRGGAVIGLIIAGIGVASFAIMFYIINTDEISDIAAGFGLGAAVCALSVRLSGSILTSAHKLSDKDESLIDYTGIFVSNGSEYSESFLLSICSIIILAEVGVDTSGVTDTFSISDAIKFPVTVMASGLAASIIGLFIFRAGTGKYSHYGFTVGNLVSGILVLAASVYFSRSILGSPYYAYCIGFGIIAQLICGEFAKTYSIGSDVFSRKLPPSKDSDIDIPMLNALSKGLISTIVPGMITSAAIMISFKIADYYGVGLAALGSCSLLAVNTAVREYATNLTSSCIASQAFDEAADKNAAYYNVYRRTSAKAKSAGRMYASVASAITLTALLMAFTHKSAGENVDISDPVVFGGIIFGTMLILVLMGLLIRSIIMSTSLMLDNSGESIQEYRNINSVRGLAILEILAILSPMAVGLVMGANCVIGFIGGSTVTGMNLIFAFNNTGRHYDRTAVESLSTVLMIMTAVAIAFVPAFIKFSGFFF